jgi:hypothetical protein
MGLQILVNYNNLPVSFDVLPQETGIYHLRLNSGQSGGDYIPEKIMIRRKGKIWISNIETCPELINALKLEIGSMYHGLRGM